MGHLVRAGLLKAGGTESELRQAINDLNHRLLYAIGEYSTPPRPEAVPF